MEMDLEPRVKSLSYKVKGISRESASQKASHVLDTDLRNHWSTGTNTKEWILLELDEPCLLSHIRIYNKSVLEWEISVGLRYKLLQDLTSRLVMFLPQLEADINRFPDAAEPTIRFLATLAGPLYPILHIVNKRELQRELEQAESSLRPSRREFSSSTHSGRPRERYRERENGRPTNEGNLRTSSGSLQREFANPNSSMSATPTVVLSGSRQFSGQLPTILQSCDRPDEGGSSYEENFDGSRDSGDTGSVGDNT